MFDYDTSAMSDPGPSLATPYRTHTCGQLRASDAGTEARLSGWVHRRRDHGQLIFLDLRDRHGLTQVVVDAADAPEAHAVAGRIIADINGRVIVIEEELPGFDLSLAEHPLQRLVVDDHVFVVLRCRICDLGPFRSP